MLATADAGVWGLVRAVRVEFPGRLVLADVDGCAESWAALGGAVASGEPELRIRRGRVFVPRLVRVVSDVVGLPSLGGGDSGGPADFGGSAGFGGVVSPVGAHSTVWGGGSVLVTGGTGGVGAVLARHLVVAYGVRRLVLVSRRGLGAPGAVGLRDELVGLGAEVSVVACDVSDRGAVVGLLAGVGDLCGVVHAAGVLSDGLLGSLSVERLGVVWGPKADGARWLHELTVGRGLSLFVLVSSVAGTLGSVGQANYAAANAFLDGLAVRRREVGLPGVSVAFGLWDVGLGAGLGSVDVERMRRAGMPALSVGEGLRLFDAALASG
ncbi:beta-ketoacyl reductase, partial [Rhizomonospora bruguierae]|uniref:beta-ketoacyl reductase n=1 Tax=Rhizomonospora bruguierae TaxID=1581705 RepID=UPI0035E44E21